MEAKTIAGLKKINLIGVSGINVLGVGLKDAPEKNYYT